MPIKAFALTVSPVKVELSSDPGKTVSSQFDLFNEQKNDLTLYSSFENFEAQGETGRPNFVPGKEGLATWISAPAKITLKALEKKTVPFTVTAPKNADPGGHFAAIFWGTTPPQTEGGQVSVGAKVGILVLLKVSGQVKEGADLLGFSTQNSQRFFAGVPLAFSYRFQNSGTDRVKPDGELKIYNSFWFWPAAVLPANDGQGNVLPGSIRKFDVLWPNKSNTPPVGFWAHVSSQWQDFHAGAYKATLTINYGDSKKVVDTYRFLIIPWQLLLILIILITLLFLILSRGVKKYNEWIISKARMAN